MSFWDVVNEHPIVFLLALYCVASTVESMRFREPK